MTTTKVTHQTKVNYIRTMYSKIAMAYTYIDGYNVIINGLERTKFFDFTEYNDEMDRLEDMTDDELLSFRAVLRKRLEEVTALAVDKKKEAQQKEAQRHAE